MSDAPAELRPTPLPLRNDTILGVCEAIGQDFGFHPNWLRLVFVVSFYWAPMAVAGAYLVLGAVVAVSHWFAPASRSAAAAPAAEDQTAQDNMENAESLPLAA